MTDISDALRFAVRAIYEEVPTSVLEAILARAAEETKAVRQETTDLMRNRYGFTGVKEDDIRAGAEKIVVLIREILAERNGGLH